MSESKETPPPAPARASRRGLLLASLLIPAAALGWFVWKANRLPEPITSGSAERSLLALDLTRPDALIESQSLATLPRDLLDVPVLKDLLSEDFVFYYQSNYDRLGIVGSLRRIAYEHELELQDDLIAGLLDEPAQVALWRGVDGKLAHAMLVIRRGALAKLMQPLLQAAADDSQLNVVGMRHVGRDEVPLFRLNYGYQRGLLFAAYEDRLLVLTDPQMLQSGMDRASAVGELEAAGFDAVLAGKDPYPERFGLDDFEGKQRITVSSDYLALGYGRFVPTYAGVSAQLDDEGWHAQLALSSTKSEALQFDPLWQAMPMGAAVCAATPVSAPAMQAVLAKLGQTQSIPASLSAQVAGPAALCWYPGSRVYTPLLVTRLADPKAANLDADLASAFEHSIGAYEAAAEGDRFPVESEDGPRWTRVVGSEAGLHASDKSALADQLGTARYFRVSMARQGDLLLFSLDDDLVKQAQAVVEKRYPPLAEQLPAERVVPLYVAPKELAGLVEAEVLRSLPRDVEAVFRNAAEAHLLPKLRALGQHPAFAANLPADTSARRDWTWVDLAWSAP